MCREGQEWQAPMAADVLEACAKLCWQGAEQGVARAAGGRGLEASAGLNRGHGLWPRIVCSTS